MTPQDNLLPAPALGYRVESAPVPDRAGGDIGALVFGAADGDHEAWEALVSAHVDMVASITTAHRLTEADALEVGSTVWHLLERNLHKLRQPDQVGAWLAAVTRDECVRVLTSPG